MSRKLCSKVVVNVRYGGFGLSAEAVELLTSKHGVTIDVWNVPRNLAALVDVVETLGVKANGEHAALNVVQLKRGAKYVLYEYDGTEWITECHRVFDDAAKKWRLPADPESATIVRTPAK